MDYEKCGHGKKYKGEECPECDALWEQMTMTKREKELTESLRAVLEICRQCKRKKTEHFGTRTIAADAQRRVEHQPTTQGVTMSNTKETTPLLAVRSNVGLGKDISKMRDASYLLSPPVGEVVRELIGEIERLQRSAEPVAWRHETTCEFISDEMKREFPDTLFVRKCNIPLFGDPVIGTTEAISRPSDVILRKQIDAQNVALQEAREEYAMLKEQFESANEKLLSRNGRIKELCEIIMGEYPDSDDRFQMAASTYSALGYFRDA